MLLYLEQAQRKGQAVASLAGAENAELARSYALVAKALGVESAEAAGPWHDEAFWQFKAQFTEIAPEISRA